MIEGLSGGSGHTYRRTVIADGSGRAAVEGDLAERLRSVLLPGRAPGVVVFVEGAGGIGKSHPLARGPGTAPR